MRRVLPSRRKPTTTCDRSNWCADLTDHRSLLSQRAPIVLVLDVPQALEVRIGPPPSGYVYGIVDGDVVKLAVGAMLVVDAVNSLVQ